MSEQPTVLLIGASAERDKVVRAALRDVAIVRGERTLSAALASGGVRLALVDLVGDVAAGLRAIEELQRSAHAVPVIALAATKDPDLILQAMRAGAREFVVPSDVGELARVVEQLSRKLSLDAATGQVVSLFSAKGGLGATTLAANLAGTLALEPDARVVLVDLDLQLGDVLVFLDAASRYTIADVLHNQRRLDRELLSSSLVRHSSGTYLLAQSDHLEEADKVTPAQIPALLGFLSRHFRLRRVRRPPRLRRDGAGGARRLAQGHAGRHAGRASGEERAALPRRHAPARLRRRQAAAHHQTATRRARSICSRSPTRSACRCTRRWPTTTRRCRRRSTAAFSCATSRRARAWSRTSCAWRACAAARLR